jgi:ABC-2 type transport system ATP-binding protein
LKTKTNFQELILDEPVLGFDAIMRSQFYELLSDSFENHSRLILVSTHLIDEIAKSAEELIIIDHGNILFQSTINDIDEKAYSITGMTKDVMPVLSGLHVIGQKTIGGFTTAFIYDRRTEIPGNLTIQPIGLQDFFINMVRGNTNEHQL